MFTSKILYGSPQSGTFRRYRVFFICLLILIVHVATYDASVEPNVPYAMFIVVATLMTPISFFSAYRINRIVKRIKAQDPSFDFSGYTNRELMRQVKAQAKSAKSDVGFGKALMTGYMGTDKKVRCRNCGVRLMRVFGKWVPYSSAASACAKRGHNCVGVEDPSP